jgi:hypothetical protein
MIVINKERDFLYSSTVMTTGMVALIRVMAVTIIFWFNGLGPQFID